MRETRENVEKRKHESLAAVHTHTHTNSFSEIIIHFREKKRSIINEDSKEQLPLNKRGQAAVTLVALVVTIIVLILLAGVSISLVIGNNGIMQKAAKGREDYTGAAINEQLDLNKIEDYIEDNTSNKSEIEKYRKSGKYFESETTIKDENENEIKIPQGFKIAQDSGLNVTEGIVIEDNDIIEGVGNNRGNQYVWVPVGNGIKKNDGTEVNITLGRYTFADGTSDKDTNGNVLAKGTPTLKQDAVNYTQEVEITYNGYKYKELSTSRVGVANGGLEGLNTTALNLKGFVDSVKANGGYYIARYEASYGTDGKANSKVSDSYTTSSSIPNKEGQLWNNRTQINAATASRNLYTAINSDLINSYAWDTAIVYIQNFSGDTDYSRQNSLNKSLANTGANGDEKCKINDMASNTKEWTTEYCTYTNSKYAYPCAYRGGYYNNSSYYTDNRDYDGATNQYSYVSFRCALYM